MKPSPLLDARNFYADETDLAVFRDGLAFFLPNDIFDFHAHLYDAAHMSPKPTDFSPVGYEQYRQTQRAWMGDLAPRDGLFFPMPARSLDISAANNSLHKELQNRPSSRGLMMISPRDEAAKVEAQVLECGWQGFKVYHLFAAREDTMNAEIEEYLPAWAWEIAHRHELAIMLHMVKPRALADEQNQNYIRDHCRRYPGAKLILAHAAHGFCAQHTVEGIVALRGLDNVYFDTSAICEAPALEAILREFGPSRLLYGSDFPISEGHGRCVSLGDGFHWIYESDQPQWPQGKPILIGIESLRALKTASHNLSLNDDDLNQIFRGNAHRLLGLAGEEKQTDEQQLYREAKQFMPGGTQLLSKRPEMFAPDVWPPYFQQARGCELRTLNGKWLLDFSTNGIGSCLLGYAHPAVSKAVARRVRLGAMSSLNPPEEVELARRLIALHPWSEQARFARTGGEAMAVAVRIARAATRRDAVAICGYHGWSDWYLAANLGGEENLIGHLLPGLQPDGVPRGLGGTVLPFTYNDLDALRQIISAHGGNLAAVVMEPTRNADPDEGFLEGVRALCDESGARLIFDEITIGFRLHNGGAHLKYGVAPDIAVFAKSLGNGHPMAAVIGRRSTLSAAEHSFISSTYWTESVGPVAALAVLDVFAREDVPAHVARIGAQTRDGLMNVARKNGVPLKVGGYPCLVSLSFDHEHAAELLTLFTIGMLERGFLAGGGFYPTLAHTTEHVEAYLAAADAVMANLGEAIADDDVPARLQTPVKHSGFKRLI